MSDVLQPRKEPGAQMRGEPGLRRWLLAIALLLVLAASPVDAAGPPPRIDSIAPDHGSTDGGTTVVLRGKHLRDATQVAFGDTPAEFLVDDDTQITATAPAHAAGTVDVVVTTEGGSRAVAFRYVAPAPTDPPPVIDTVWPPDAPVGGGTQITINGSGLASATGVWFGAVAAASWSVVDEGQVVAVTPAHDAGSVDLLIKTPNASATHPFGFTAPEGQPPVIESLSPAAGPSTGGTEVVVVGQHLSGVTNVSFGGNAASWHLDGQGRVVATTPPHPAGQVAVVLTSPDGSATAPFVYEADNETADNETHDETANSTGEPTAAPTQAPEEPVAQPTTTSTTTMPLDEVKGDASTLGVPADIRGIGGPRGGFGPCWVLLAPSAPGHRIVVPFARECGVEAVVVQVPEATGLLNVSVSALTNIPAGVPSPGMRTGPGLVFEATILDQSGHEVQPADAVLQVRMPGAWLDTCPPERCATTLFHYDGTAWTTHRMRSIDQGEDMVVLQAEVSSFSLFAVGGTALPPAPFQIAAWAWGLLLLGAVTAPTALIAARRRGTSDPEGDQKVGRLLEEMAHKEELLQFINNAAHDLANPLTPIQLQLDLLAEAAENNDPEQQRQAVGMVQQNVDQLTMLIGDLRDASKLRSGRLRLFPADEDLGRIVFDCVTGLRVQAADAGVDLAVENDGQAVPVRVDRGRLIQVLTNIVGNAIKFTPEGGTIRVCVDVHEGMARFQVIDTGLGLSQEDAASLFMPFSQAHDDEQRAKGTGLGLFIAKGITEAHGGRIGCHSEGPGLGSTFWVTLPLARRGQTV